MQHIRAITFDLDDTLWEIHPVIRRAEQALYSWLREYYPKITDKFEPDDLRGIRSKVVEEHPSRAHDLTFLRYTTLSNAAAAVGYNDDFINDAFHVFDEVRNDVEIFPGVRSTLATLSEHYQLLAVTNGNANLERIGIAKLFDDVITAASVGAAKPAREIFDAAVEAAGVSAAETLHVGDHIEFDVRGAMAAGLPAAWLNRTGNVWPHSEMRPIVEIAHVSELLPFLLADH